MLTIDAQFLIYYYTSAIWDPPESGICRNLGIRWNLGIRRNLGICRNLGIRRNLGFVGISDPPSMHLMLRIMQTYNATTSPSFITCALNPHEDPQIPLAHQRALV